MSQAKPIKYRKRSFFKQQRDIAKNLHELKLLFSPKENAQRELSVGDTPTTLRRAK